MNVLVHLILCIGALALAVVVGTFMFLMMGTALDTIEEQRQARERDRRRE